MPATTTAERIRVSIYRTRFLLTSFRCSTTMKNPPQSRSLYRLILRQTRQTRQTRLTQNLIRPDHTHRFGRQQLCCDGFDAEQMDGGFVVPAVANREVAAN